MTAEALIGSWQSFRSTIPNYTCGSEWLHFVPTGEHRWEVGQPGNKGRPSLNTFTLYKEGADYRFVLSLSNGLVSCPPLKIQFISGDEIAITPEHGFVTIFKRAERQRPVAPEVETRY